ncbi:MAG TPA: signal peptidase I [Gaiella sp.]
MAERAEPREERQLSDVHERDPSPDPDVSPQQPSPLPGAPERAGEPAPDGETTGWPTTPAEIPPAGAAPGTQPREEPAAPHPRHHSRNPVDRLTRGLPDPVRVIVDWAVTIVAAVAIVLLVKAYVVNPYKIPSSSMEPTLHCARPKVGCEARFDDRVLANRFIFHLRSPHRGEIVVFDTPAAARVACGEGGTFVKRVIGLPGETVEVRLNARGKGIVYIDGKPLKEPYLQPDRLPDKAYGPQKVPEGNYFMMGDNRSQSCDSREWGAVPRDHLIGKVFATYWPPNRISFH